MKPTVCMYEVVDEKIISNDETHFHLKVNVRKCNSWISALENSHEIYENGSFPKESFRIGGIKAQISFEIKASSEVTVDGWRYRNKLQEFVFEPIGSYGPR